MATAITVESVRKHFGKHAAVAGVDLEIGDGEFFTMLGPSGCGKTTTLRMIAGFEQPDEGRILLRGDDVTHVPPNRRNVNMVFQHYALFPHLTVSENICFGLRLKKLSRREQQERVRGILEVVGLEGLEKRKPGQLSGGQQQRVALARALVNRPTALLLDEPLGALDVKLRKQLQLELKRVQEELGTTFVYVTHDQEEALGMSDRIAVMNGGKVEQIGAPRDVYAEPETAFVADFIGSLNAVDFRVDELDGGLAVMRVGEDERVVVTAAPGTAKGESVKAAVRPERIRVVPEGDAAPVGGSRLRGRVAEIVFLGPLTHVHVDTAAGRLVSYRMDDETTSRLREGAAVVLTWAPEHGAVLA